MKINLTNIKKTLLILSVAGTFASCTTVPTDLSGENQAGLVESESTASVGYETDLNGDTAETSVSNGFTN